MFRWLLNIATAVSLLIALLCVAAWVRGYWVCDNIIWLTRFGYLAGEFQTGQVIASQERPSWMAAPVANRHYTSAPESPATWTTRRKPSLSLGEKAFFSMPGLLYVHTDNWEYNGDDRRQIVLSWWLPILIFSLLPSRWLFQLGFSIRRWRRQRKGLCRQCGYDLRASKEKCPECGTPVPAASSAGPADDTVRKAS
jgi:hypothetical protein